MNKRHIQTFLTVSAAFFATSAPLHANATCNTVTTPANRCAQYAPTPLTTSLAAPAGKTK